MEALGSALRIMRLPLTRLPEVTVLAEPVLTSPSVQRLRIMIADDNQDAAESLSMLLELAGHEVRIAHLGEAALSLAQVFRPDIALLDIGMPDLSGYEVAQTLRLEPWGKGIQLIALTGLGQDEDRRRAREAGFDHHLTKPIDSEVLAKLLSNDQNSGDQPN